MSTDVKDEIMEMEKIGDDNIVVVYGSNKSLHKLSELFNRVKKEVLIILPSTNGFFRTEMSGGFNEINKIGAKGIQIKILTFTDKDYTSEIKRIKTKYTNITFRELEQASASMSRIMIFDKEMTVIWEIKNDYQIEHTDALGKAVFMDAIKTSETIASIFESLWTQPETHARLKETQEKLKAHDKIQSRFMDLVTHELRTPLQSVLGFTEILKEEITNDEQKFMLRLIITNAKKLQRLSENILDITRLENNILYLNKEEFDLNELVKSTIGDYITNSEYTKSISFDYQNFDRKYPVKADKIRIAQVIHDLVDNSVRFTQNDGKIVLTLSEKTIHSKEIVVLSVSDNGENLGPEILSRLFTKFSLDSYYGVGISLYLCKKLLEAHDGRIWVLNNRNECGCTFSFGIPKNG